MIDVQLFAQLWAGAELSRLDIRTPIGQPVALNLGESLNDLRRFIFFAHRGKVRYPRHDDQTTQAHCHSLVVNACVLSTTEATSKTPYSVPARLAGLTVAARVGAREISFWHDGRQVAIHERLPGRHGTSVQLDHYLDLL